MAKRIEAREHVYFNLHRSVWSVMLRGKVQRHTPACIVTAPLDEGVRFVVREGGRQRVLREGRKNVHAFVVGNVIDAPNGFADLSDQWVPVTYRPTDGGTFTRRDTGAPVTAATAVYMRADRKLLAFEPR